MMKQTIAIVEDDIEQRGLYAQVLLSNDYEVIEFGDRQSAIDAFEQALPDLVILDIALGIDVGGGFEVCRYLQQRDVSLPVIFLTSRGDELDKIYGLQLGAWDYQTKPVSLEYLLVRIESFFNIKRLSSANVESNIDGAVSAERKNGEPAKAGQHNTNGKITRSDLTINTRSMQCF